MSKTQKATTGHQLWQVLEASGLLATEPLSRVRAQLESAPDAITAARQLVRAGVITRWQAKQLLAGRHTLTLGKYRLCDALGRSATGPIFLAEHVQMQRQVAIKTIARRLTQQPDDVNRFLDEARKAAALDHANIRHIYDIDNHRDRYFLVMEYVSGWDLEQLVHEKGPRPIAAAADYVRQAAEGVLHIHRAGLIHGRLSPSNVMVTDQGVIKILGLATGHLNANIPVGQLSDSNQPVESMAYRAPEQSRADGMTDGRADLFALGGVGHFLLTGRPPADHRTRSAAGDPLPLTAIDQEQSRWEAASELATIFRAMMAPDLESRTETATTVIHALREWIDRQNPLDSSGGVQPKTEPSEPDPAPAPAIDVVEDSSFSWTPDQPTAEPASKSSGTQPSRTEPRSLADPLIRRRVTAVVVLALATMATIAAGIWVWHRQAQERPRETAQQPAERPAPRDTLTPTPVQPAADSDQVEAKPAAAQPTDSDESPDPAPPMTAVDSGPTNQAIVPGVQTTPPEDTDDSTAVPPSSATNDAVEAPATTPPAEQPSEPVEPVEPDEPAGPIFARLPVAFDLPVPSPDDPGHKHQLGSLRTRPETPIEITLLGGTSAADDNLQFQLQPVGSKPAEQWQIQLQDTTSDPLREQVIARLSVDSQALNFHWTRDVESEPRLAHLTNCALRLSAANEQHDLRLRVAKTVDPLLIHPQRPSFDGKWQLAHPPATDSLRWQITALGDPLPPDFEQIPATGAKANAQPVLLKCGLEPEKQLLMFEIEGDLNRLWRMSGKIMYRLPPMDQPKTLTRKNLLTTGRQVATNQLNRNNQAQVFREQLQQLGRQDPRRGALQRQLDTAEQILEEASRLTEAWGELQRLIETVADGAALHFRLYRLVDDCEIDLLISDALQVNAPMPQETGIRTADE